MVNDQPCWEWQRRCDSDGYGRINMWHDGKHTTFRTMRVSYEFYVGTVPDGLVLDHLCRNKVCINPTHLDPVTNAVNQERIPRDTWCYEHDTLKVVARGGYVKCCKAAYAKAYQQKKREEKLRIPGG